VGEAVWLENKVAIVTGVSLGIGKAIALASGEQGATVTVDYKSHRCLRPRHREHLVRRREHYPARRELVRLLRNRSNRTPLLFGPLGEKENHEG